MRLLPDLDEGKSLSEVMQNQVEYRENAMRDRHQTGDWYTHDPASSSPASVPTGHRPMKKLNQESEAWFDYSSPSAGKSSGSPASATGPARQNGNQNWYRHDAGGSGRVRDLHPIGVSEPKLKTKRCSDERRAREAENEWFRHDNQGTPSAGAGRPSTATSNGSKKRSPTKPADEALWFAHGGSEQNGATPTSKVRHSGHDADSYYKRDKTGSGADWFPHEHSSAAAGETDGAASTPSRQASGPRGSTSNRMNVESPEWFSHDNPPSAATPRAAASAEVRKMQARATGDEVRQILRVDENVQQQPQPSAASAAPPTSGGSDGAERPQATAAHQPPNGAADRYTENLIEKFQRQAALTATTAADE